jgi:hypothetical protein
VIENPGGAPQGELFVDSVAAGPDHLSEVVLRYRNSDVALLWFAMMRHARDVVVPAGTRAARAGVR